MPKQILDEYTDRTDLTKGQKYRLRHPERAEISRQYTHNWRLKHPDHHKEYYKNNKDKKKKHARTYVLKQYALTPDEFAGILADQNYVCAICKKPNTTKQNWHVDHDHQTKQVRGILCVNCNLMLGNAKDDPIVLENAIIYLKVNSDL